MEPMEFPLDLHDVLPQPAPVRTGRPLPTPIALFCGADQPPSGTDFDARRPWRVQILPGEDNPEPPTKRRKKSNGCGTRVHTSATPMGRRWIGASDDAGSVVIPLEDQYIPHGMRSMGTKHDSCGCTRRPIGCAVCGNALGASHMICTRHQHASAPPIIYKFHHSAVSPPLPAAPARAPPAASPPSQDEDGYEIISATEIWPVFRASGLRIRDDDTAQPSPAPTTSPGSIPGNANAATTRVNRVGRISHRRSRALIFQNSPAAARSGVQPPVIEEDARPGEDVVAGAAVLEAAMGSIFASFRSNVRGNLFGHAASNEEGDADSLSVGTGRDDGEEY
ncbi:hypothetical protein C8F04DRAFT_1106159 [Mycena alexandri]|uniref:Uncharacterized protein n=1 Tax=Mycena alexandri TaxID=1745969 RepID=A0AAD6SRV0_9AGAR|nr:hypothetical protein C8F04DRAFT_1106159 [Mycena alexandri]